MSEPKFCPMSFNCPGAPAVLDGKIIRLGDRFCIQEKCAWWIDEVPARIADDLITPLSAIPAHCAILDLKK